MIIMSLNVRGVKGAPKIQSLKCLVFDCKPYIILVQETMCSGEKAMESFSPWLKEWSFCTKDTIGFSRDLLTAWSPNFKKVSAYI
jgi:exonuclease III